MDENDIKKEYIINIEYNNEEKVIKIYEKRRVYTDKDLDYTCIELFEADDIKNYFKIDPILFTNNINFINDSDIFILQFPESNELSFSYGNIKSIKDNNIIYNTSTKKGSSGSPIIKRINQNYIIGLHYGGIQNQNNKDYKFNLGIKFNSILDDIKDSNKINCIYRIEDNINEIQLLHDYNKDINEWKEED